MKSLFLAATLFAGVIGCGRGATPAPAAMAPSTTEAMVSTPATLTLGTSRNITCPLQWECSDTGQFFGSQSQCLAACTSSCFREANCSGNCVCP